MTSSSELDSGVKLHISRRVAASSRVVWIELSLLSVFVVKYRKENIRKG